MAEFTRTWRNKWLTSKAENIDDMIAALQDAVAELQKMNTAGVYLSDGSAVGDDYAILTTEDPQVAKQFGFREELDEDEEADEEADEDEDEEAEVQDIVEKEDKSMTQDMNTRHKQVIVRVGDQEEEIDEAIAPLIREIWTAGIETMMSCQEGGFGLVWIDFPSEDDIKSFLDIVAEYEEDLDSLYNRIMGRLVGCTKPEWVLEIVPGDMSLHEKITADDDETWHDGVPCIWFEYSVRFPPCDLPIVLERLRRHNEGSARALGNPVPAGL